MSGRQQGKWSVCHRERTPCPIRWCPGLFGSRCFARSSFSGSAHLRVSERRIRLFSYRFVPARYRNSRFDKPADHKSRRRRRLSLGYRSQGASRPRYSLGHSQLGCHSGRVSQAITAGSHAGAVLHSIWNVAMQGLAPSFPPCRSFSYRACLPFLDKLGRRNIVRQRNGRIPGRICAREAGVLTTNKTTCLVSVRPTSRAWDAIIIITCDVVPLNLRCW